MSVFLMTPQEVALHLAQSAQAKRLSLNMTQRSLAERSQVSFGVLKKFERSGKISLESLLKIAWVLDSLEAFMEIFKLISKGRPISLDEILRQKTRKRGRT